MYEQHVHWKYFDGRLKENLGNFRCTFFVYNGAVAIMAQFTWREERKGYMLSVISLDDFNGVEIIISVKMTSVFIGKF